MHFITIQVPEPVVKLVKKKEENESAVINPESTYLHIRRSQHGYPQPPLNPETDSCQRQAFDVKYALTYFSKTTLEVTLYQRDMRS